MLPAGANLQMGLADRADLALPKLRSRSSQHEAKLTYNRIDRARQEVRLSLPPVACPSLLTSLSAYHCRATRVREGFPRPPARVGPSPCQRRRLSTSYLLVDATLHTLHSLLTCVERRDVGNDIQLDPFPAVSLCSM